MKLTLEQVRHVAELARLGLSDDELEALAGELSSILEYIDQLEQLDTAAIAPTAQVGELVDVMREDEVRPSLDPEDALRNAPSREDGYFRVRAMQEGARRPRSPTSAPRSGRERPGPGTWPSSRCTG